VRFVDGRCIVGLGIDGCGCVWHVGRGLKRCADPRQPDLGHLRARSHRLTAAATPRPLDCCSAVHRLS
jgi:hypothetical protein